MNWINNGAGIDRSSWQMLYNRFEFVCEANPQNDIYIAGIPISRKGKSPLIKLRPTQNHVPNHKRNTTIPIFSFQS